MNKTTKAYKATGEFHSSKLFWKISFIFLLILVIFGGLTILISVQLARNYSLEVNQKLNRDLAKSMVTTINPLLQSGEINKDAVSDIIHSMMVINPIVEVYLLNPNGKISAYVAPEKVVKLEQVSLEPIKVFLKDSSNRVIYGDDPRNPGEKRIFSAAEVMHNDKISGYIYIVLASQEYFSAEHMVVGSYILGVSVRTIILILIISAVVGIIAIAIITKKLNNVIQGIKQFQKGNLKARIKTKGEDDIDRIGIVFNQMADTIENNIEQLKGLDNLRVELIGNISHDLRTPIASIQGYAETLLIKHHKISEEDRKKYLETIYKSCEKLQKLVEDLFQLSKLKTNQVKLHKEPFSIAELVHDVANKYRIISQKRGISINTIVSKDTPLVYADVSMIDRALQNLIDNALRFCKENDYINIQVETQSNKVKVSIADSGKGIKEEELPYIFERYYKGGEDEFSTGLGLAIVKGIIELHQTNIEVESRVNTGTKFSFTLPLVTSEVNLAKVEVL